MKDATIRKHSRNNSAIQFINKVNMAPLSGLFKFEAICSICWKEKRSEYTVSTWNETKEEAEMKLEKLRIDGAFEILKYQYKI